ncbi:hypothetical protein [Pleurocapsa sp. FMAR1]|uniref:hypothetical protein n=1 Tax=Pleurocapsa sp. FMAR1 TaxID=3040204 RepID=UPI0029C70F9F|nr:hypothetical protein [Pleurocapsa sp. FMAR1]
MLEIICAGSLALSLNICQRKNSIELNPIQQNIALDKKGYLAKGQPNESRYRQETDRDLGKDEIEYRDGRGSRDYQEAEQRRREIEYGSDRENENDIYWNRDRPSREEDKYYRDNRSRQEYPSRSEYYRH